MDNAGERPLVAVVDDNAALREAVESLLRSVGFAARGFESAEAFLGAGAGPHADCLILDARLPGMSGRALHRRLLADGDRVPVIFISAHEAGEEAVARALQEGAIAFLRKPFPDGDLLDALRRALAPRASRSVFRRQT
jgi:FixJ family two-component response regulator